MTNDDTIQNIADHYDRTLYTSNAFPYSAPSHVRATAHLYGVDAPPVENARVLELGCAAGGNLLPFVLSYPNASAVGVDLSPAQVAQGQKVIDDLKITNLTLHAMDLTKIDRDFGTFDYIIVHGVFSWVPPEVKQAILRICRENLSPDGVAYISYNTYPGWKAGDIVRDAMLLHSHSAQSDPDKLASARTMLTLLSDGLAASNPLAPSLKAAVAQLQKYSDYYIAHEYLEAFNTPCYFVEFVDSAQQAGLAYVGDADGQTELNQTYGRNVQLHHSLIALGQPKAMRQQYLDFAVGRNFRKSLLISAESTAQPSVEPDTTRLADIRVAGHFTRTENQEKTAGGRASFRNQRGLALHTNNPVILAIIESLTRRWPASASLDELCTDNAPPATPGDAHRTNVLEGLQTLYRLNMLHLSREKSPYETHQKGLGPKLIPGFSHLVNRPAEDNTLGRFNVWHDTVNLRLRPTDATILPFIDGTNTEAQLRTRLRDALHAGTATDSKGRTRTGERNLDTEAQSMLNRLLKALKQTGVLLP